jgi:phospholipid transport system substrate-binding protein
MDPATPRTMSQRLDHFPVRQAGLALAALLSVVVALPGAAVETPEQVVDRTAQQVVDILANQSLSSDAKRQQIEDVVYSRVDFVILSKLVLARNWSKLSAAQQDEFMQEFRKHLSVTYGRNVDSYKNEKVSIVGGHPDPNGDYTVQSKILRGGPDDIAVDYRLRQRDGNWLIIDIVVEGVSLVSNFRSQFQEIISNGGPEKLLRLLHDKNTKGEPLKS